MVRENTERYRLSRIVEITGGNVRPTQITSSSSRLRCWCCDCRVASRAQPS